MRCVTLAMVISILLIGVFTGCSKEKNEVLYVYASKQISGKSHDYRDTISIKKVNDSTSVVTIYMHGKEKQYKVEQRPSFVKIFYKDTSTVLFSTNDDSVHDNLIEEKFISPYFARNTRFIASRSYNIDGQSLSVYLFRTDNHSSLNSFVYYSPEFGFICYTNLHIRYWKLIDIVNESEQKKNTAVKLMNAVVRDSIFFINTDRPKPGSMKFYPPKE